MSTSNARPTTTARSFLGKGIAFPLRINASGAMAMSEGADNIEQGVRSILGTAIGERVMRPLFGCRIHDYVFHPNSPTTAGFVAFYVREALDKWEPRIREVEVDAFADNDNPAQLNVHIRYQIIATNEDRNLVYPFYLRREQDL